MANAATRLADYLESIRVIPLGKKTLDVRQAAGGQKAMLAAVSDYAEVLALVDRMERDGRNVAVIRETIPEWTGILFSSGAWDASGNGRLSGGTKQGINVLRMLGEQFETMLWGQLPDGKVIARALDVVREVRAAVASRDGLLDGIRTKLLTDLDEIEQLLNNWPQVDTSLAILKVVLLLGWITILIETTVEPDDVPWWRKLQTVLIDGIVENGAWFGFGVLSQHAMGLLGG